MSREKTDALWTVVERADADAVYTLTDAEGNAVASVCAGELRALLQEQRPDNAEKLFRDIFAGEIDEKDALRRAVHLGIRSDVKRMIYLVELGREDAAETDTRVTLACEVLRQIYSDTDIVVALNHHALALVHNISGKKERAAYASEAEAIVSTIHTELLEAARISYGNVATDFNGLAQSYREARVAMEIAEVFYGEREVVSYAELGIGRLIYELPISLCELFLTEVFGERKKVKFEEQEIATVNKFFENNLNLSETARELYIHRNTLVYHLEKLQKRTGLDIRNFDDALTLKIALMVKRYLEYVSKQERG